MTTTRLESPADEQKRLEAEALAEHEQWKQRLELERWTTSGQDPATAIAQLIARELYTGPRTRIYA